MCVLYTVNYFNSFIYLFFFTVNQSISLMTFIIIVIIIIIDGITTTNNNNKNYNNNNNQDEITLGLHTEVM